MFRTLTPIFSVVIAVAIFFFFAKPMFAEIREVQDQTNKYREAVAKAEEFNRELQRLINKRNEFSARDLERLDALVPASIDEVQALIDLQALANESGMLFGNIEVEKVDVSADLDLEPSSQRKSLMEQFDTVDISFGLIGTYEQMRAMLDAIEKSLVLMEIMHVDFEVTEGDLQQYNFTIRLYSLTPLSQQN
ncbi:MAG: hypothetical protein LR017_04150 [Candidatus Pacebacteria bacterium]|nr:hypothetical protein [Candidatus Paceibacterota bacterium]